MDKLLKNIASSGILIGSRQWGGLHPKSDWDVVLSTSKTEKLLDYFDKRGIEYEDRGKTASADIEKHTMFNENNIKVELGDELLNILSYKESDIQKIAELNNTMEKIKETEIGRLCASDKAIRIAVVETFLNVLFGKVIPSDGYPGLPEVDDFDEDDMPF